MLRWAMAEAGTPIFSNIAHIADREVADFGGLAELIEGAREPFVVRGLVADWPLVRAGLESAAKAREHLLAHARAMPFTVALGPPGHGGRMFYADDMQMNFREGTGKLADIFGGFDRYEGEDNPPTAYVPSVDMNRHFNGLTEANPSPVAQYKPRESIWIGTRTRIAAHNDFPDNLACCAVGRRRFTLFPPEQFENLYLGPVDNTPAGRAVSMVDFHQPDFTAHPRFEAALETALTTELEPGDAVFIPSMWWHHVEGLAPFNVLVNYWWRETPKWLGQPQDALNHAILAIRDLPPQDRAIWKQMFDHYVFEHGPNVTDHIPEGARGILDPLTPEGASRIRSFLLRALNQ